MPLPLLLPPPLPPSPPPPLKAVLGRDLDHGSCLNPSYVSDRLAGDVTLNCYRRRGGKGRQYGIIWYGVKYDIKPSLGIIVVTAGIRRSYFTSL